MEDRDHFSRDEVKPPPTLAELEARIEAANQLLKNIQIVGVGVSGNSTDGFVFNTDAVS